jgi:hypothetical protein
MTKLGIGGRLVAMLLLLGGWVQDVAAADNRPAPSWNDVYQLLKQNLPGATDDDLNRAAVEGAVDKLQPKVTLLKAGEGAAPETEPALSRTNTFDGGIGYLRVARVDDGLAASLVQAIGGLNRTNPIRGLALDLRYANGSSLPAAARAADPFIAKEATLLKWQGETLVSKAEPGDVSVPLVVLVNAKTAGAAEVLAGLIKDTASGLTIGGKTAGEASEYKEFPLSDGCRLRIAVAPLVLGGGTELSTDGILPDIAVTVEGSEERAYYEDPFRVAARPGLAAAGLSSTNLAGVTNRVARRTRYNEADLVRDRREGSGLEDLPPRREPEPEAPVVHDPALARALDLLKGLAVVRQIRK